MRTRYLLLDFLRGLALLNMIVYHLVWDLVNLYQVDWAWYASTGAKIWQQGICWTFILVSGFCFPLGSHPKKRGLVVFCCGGIITLITLVVLPSAVVVFGILTLLGSCMLILAFARGFLQRVPPLLGVCLSFFLFFLSRRVSQGAVSLFGWHILELPQAWYRNIFTAYFGFSGSGFSSTDYFPLFPWLFLYLAGFYLYRLLARRNGLGWLVKGRARTLEALGRYALPIYMGHQVGIYVLLLGVFACLRS